jgi:hypothetical protein
MPKHKSVSPQTCWPRHYMVHFCSTVAYSRRQSAVRTTGRKFAPTLTMGREVGYISAQCGECTPRIVPAPRPAHERKPHQTQSKHKAEQTQGTTKKPNRDESEGLPNGGKVRSCSTLTTSSKAPHCTQEAYEAAQQQVTAPTARCHCKTQEDCGVETGQPQKLRKVSALQREIT